MMNKTVTSREREILQLISQGYSTREIAIKLFVSEDTVKSHRRHLFSKLAARNSPHLVNKALSSGLPGSNLQAQKQKIHPPGGLNRDVTILNYVKPVLPALIFIFLF